MPQNIIIVDADHLDHVAFDLTVNFERMLGRRIPQADLAHWLDCIALDGGLRPGNNTTQAVFIHSKDKPALTHFRPGNFEEDLTGKAFRDNLGEFELTSPAVEPLIRREDLIVQSFEAMLLDREVERIMLVADLDGQTEESARMARRIKTLCQNPPKPDRATTPLPPKDITLFAMQPLSGRGFAAEILGYSLTAALGISGEEFQ